MTGHTTRTVLLAGLLAMSASSRAAVVGPAFTSGNELLAKCQAVPLYRASQNDPNKGSAVAKESAEAMGAGGYCLGFIAEMDPRSGTA
jgi:hypothetical protein